MHSRRDRRIEPAWSTVMGSQSQNVLFDAVKADDVDAVLQELERDKQIVNALDDWGWTPLFYAASPDVVQVLVRSGADVNYRGRNCWTPLHAATYSRNYRVADALLDGIADPNPQTDAGETPLHFAVDNADLRLVNLLLARGAHPNVEDNDRLTPVHYACLNGVDEEIASRLAIASALIASGANVNARNNDGVTPLHWAFGSGYAEFVQLLLSHGADLSVADAQGLRPRDWAGE